MKTAIIVCQNTADVPLAALDGRSLLGAARARAATGLARHGCGGWIDPPGSHQSLLAQACGLSPGVALRLRRGPVEARLLDPPPGEGDMVYRVDLIAEDNGVIRSSPVTGAEEARELALALNQGIDPGQGRFAHLDCGALILMLRGVGEDLPEGLPTDQVLGQVRMDVIPDRRGTGRLREVMDQAGEILSRHPVNEIRVDLGEDPANGIWLHGGGRWPDTAGPAEPVPSTCLLTDSQVGQGIGRLLGAVCLPLRRPDPSHEGAWFHVPALVGALRGQDALVVDVSLHRGDDAIESVRELDQIDQHLLAPLLDILNANRPYRVALIAGAREAQDGQAPSPPRLPVVVAGDDLGTDDVERWEESACSGGTLGGMDLSALVRELHCTDPPAAPDGG